MQVDLFFFVDTISTCAKERYYGVLAPELEPGQKIDQRPDPTRMSKRVYIGPVITNIWHQYGRSDCMDAINTRLHDVFNFK